MKILVPINYVRSLNNDLREHWAKRRRISRALLGYVLAGKGKSPDADGPRTVIITRYAKKRFDDDNMIGGCKMLLDALVRAKVLTGDAPECGNKIEYRQVSDKFSDMGACVVVEVLD